VIILEIARVPKNFVEKEIPGFQDLGILGRGKHMF